MLIVLFGNPGVGKSYIGKLLQQQYGYFLYDADADLTPAAIQAIQEEQIFSPQMEAEFVDIVITRISKLHQQHKNIIVAQAFGREAPRQKLFNSFKDIKFYFVQVSDELANQRLAARNDWVNIAYADKIRQEFEQPLIPHQVIDNSQDDPYVLQQFANFLGHPTHNK